MYPTGGGDEAISRTMEDVRQLEHQIRNLLRTMENVGNIESVPALPLLETEPQIEGEPEVQMRWICPDASERHRQRGKVFEKAEGTGTDWGMRGPGNKANTLGELSNLDVLEMCLNENAAQYLPVENSAFFVPALDVCVFGVSLINVSQRKLHKPTVEASMLPGHNCSSSKKGLFRSLFYNAEVTLKDVNIETLNMEKLHSSGIAFQETFASSNNEDNRSQQVMPGCEVLVTVKFDYPGDIMQSLNGFRLMFAVILGGKQLWARQISITHKHFHASNIDGVFKQHHTSVLTALGTKRECFQLDRLLSLEDKSPFRAMERFLTELGYLNIGSGKSGLDTSIEVYTTNQPSLLWGTCFKIERCSRKPARIRCLVTTRTAQQMQVLYCELKNWIERETRKEKNTGISGLTVSGVQANGSRFSSQSGEKMSSEIRHILKIQQSKSSLKGERQGSDRTARRKLNSLDSGSCDTSWILAYSTAVTETDAIFVRLML